MSNTLKGMPVCLFRIVKKAFLHNRHMLCIQYYGKIVLLKRLLADSYFLFCKFQLSKNFTLG